MRDWILEFRFWIDARPPAQEEAAQDDFVSVTCR
jgi:hypothetical protein